MVEGAAALLDQSALTGEPLPVTRPDGRTAAERRGECRCGLPHAGEPRRRRPALMPRSCGWCRPPRNADAPRWSGWRIAGRSGSSPFRPASREPPGGSDRRPGRALAVLVVATPCPLILAAPVAIGCRHVPCRAARHRVKGGGALERLARVRTVLFDKTGTLTTGRRAELPWSRRRPSARISFCGSRRLSTKCSTHTFRRPSLRAARAAASCCCSPNSVQEISGGGLPGMVEGRALCLGTAGIFLSCWH